MAKKCNTDTQDIEVLRKRIMVTRNELPYLLGMGICSAVAFAKEIGAEVVIGGRRMYSVSKIEKYISEVTE